MGQIGQLYGLEKKAQKVDATRRRELRQKHALPRLEKFKTWLDQQAEELLPKSPLRAAVQYARNQWEALCRYTEHGDLTIDNILSERTLRCVAVGRKNWCAPDVLSRASGRLFGSGCLVGNVLGTLAV